MSVWFAKKQEQKGNKPVAGRMCWPKLKYLHKVDYFWKYPAELVPHNVQNFVSC